MSEIDDKNYIDALVYSSIKNTVPSNSWTDISPDFRDLNKILEDTTIKRACCMMKGGKKSEKYEVNVRLPLFDDKSYESTEIEKKFGYRDKKIIIPSTICDEPKYKDYSYDGSSGTTKCDIFYKAYCKNIYEEYKKLSGGDDNSINLFEFAKFKPECACYTPPLPGMAKELVLQPQCWQLQCKDSQYKQSNNRGQCTLNIQNCIQNIENKFEANIKGSEVKFDGAKQINDCVQNTGGNATKSADKQTESQTSAIKEESDKLINDNIPKKEAPVPMSEKDKIKAEIKAEEKKPEESQQKKEESQPKPKESQQKSEDMSKPIEESKMSRGLIIGIILFVLLLLIFAVVYIKRRNANAMIQ